MTKLSTNFGASAFAVIQKIL